MHGFIYFVEITLAVSAVCLVVQGLRGLMYRFFIGMPPVRPSPAAGWKRSNRPLGRCRAVLK